MELETVNKLYLELSQIATARTAKEIALEAAVARRGKLIQDIFNADEGNMTPGLWKRASDELTKPAV